jgi:vanillate O-demethylase ferredoxin subunit
VVSGTDVLSSDRRVDIRRFVTSPPRNAHVYACGPAGLNAGVVNATLRAGFPYQQLHLETFAVGKFGTDNRSFTVEIASTHQQFNIPADHTILEILDQNGVFIPSMCRQGIYGICITNVLSGQVDHQDSYLTPEERTRDHAIPTCCSGDFTSHLTLDL